MNNPLSKLALVAAAVLAVGLATPACAKEAIPQQSASTSTSTTAIIPAKPALWKVSDDDTTIYLFGTVHVLPARIDWFEGPVAAAFKQSDTLVTEIVDADSKTMQDLVASTAVLPTGETLRGLLPEDQRAAFEAALTKFGLPPAMFDHYEPWYVALALSTLPLLQDGFAKENGVEAVLDAKAKAREMPHDALETPQYQLGVFDSLPMQVQETYLSEVIQQLPNARDELRQMVDAWRRGDPATLAALMNDDTSDPYMVKVLLTDRNKAWATWVGSRLERPGTVFLAVGAGHLGGPESLQDLLKSRNIRVERLQ